MYLTYLHLIYQWQAPALCSVMSLPSALQLLRIMSREANAGEIVAAVRLQVEKKT